MPKPLLTNNLVKFTIAVSVALLCMTMICIVVTPSIDKHLLLRDFFSGKTISNRDYVEFPLDHELIGGKHRVVKIVGCIAGQYLERTNDGFYCDGKKVEAIRLYRDSGDPLPQFEFKGPIPAGKLFVIGTTTYSFGSRHWGFVDVADARRMIPII